MGRPRLSLCIAALGAFLVVSCAGAARPPKQLPLCIVATGELNGVLAPCGCAPDQLGGLPRRATLLSSYKTCTQRLILDNGNLTAGFGPAETLKAETTIRSLAQMGYFAVNLGERDVFLGIETLKRLREQAPTVHWVSANVRRASGDLPVEAFALWKAEGSPAVLVVGVLSRIYEPQLKAVDKELSIEEPALAVQRVLDESDARAELVVLMVHGPVAEGRELAKAFPQVNVLIAGQEDAPASVGRLGPSQVLLIPGPDGEQVVSAAVERDPGSNSWTISPREVAPLSKNLADSPEVRELLKQYQQRLFEEKLLDKMPRRKFEGGLELVGSQSCQPCHKLEYEAWSKQRHAHAYETLVEDGQQYDPDCVTCHVTGFGSESGFTNVKETPDLAAVGCEACHRPGNLHIQDRLKPKEAYAVYGQTEPADCVACHTEARSPNYDYETYLPKMRHWDLDEAGKK